MYLILWLQVEAAALKRWGNLESLEAERQQRRETRCVCVYVCVCVECDCVKCDCVKCDCVKCDCASSSFSIPLSHSLSYTPCHFLSHYSFDSPSHSLSLAFCLFVPLSPSLSLSPSLPLSVYLSVSIYLSLSISLSLFSFFFSLSSSLPLSLLSLFCAPLVWVCMLCVCGGGVLLTHKCLLQTGSRRQANRSPKPK